MTSCNGLMMFSAFDRREMEMSLTNFLSQLNVFIRLYGCIWGIKDNTVMIEMPEGQILYWQ